MANIPFPPKIHQERAPEKDGYYDVLASNLADYCAALVLDEPVKSAKVDIIEQAFAKGPILQHNSPWPVHFQGGFVGKATGTGVFIPYTITNNFNEPQRRRQGNGVVSQPPNNVGANNNYRGKEKKGKNVINQATKKEAKNVKNVKKNAWRKKEASPTLFEAKFPQKKTN